MNFLYKKSPVLSQLNKIRCKEPVRNLGCTSEIIEELLTIILRNNFLHFLGTVWKQLQIIDIAG
jgi:hypothetical protein